MKANLKGTWQVCPASGTRPIMREDGQGGTRGATHDGEDHENDSETRSTKVRAPVLPRDTRALKALQGPHPRHSLTFGQ